MKILNKIVTFIIITTMVFTLWCGNVFANDESNQKKQIEGNNLTFSREINLISGETIGYLVYAEDRQTTPNIYVENENIATTCIVNENDSRGYYCEITGISEGETNIIAEQNGKTSTLDISVKQNTMQFSREFTLTKDMSGGFLIYSDLRDDVPSVYLEDRSLGSVRVVNSNDDRGYYCEIYPSKPGTTNIIAEMNGVKISAPVSISSTQLSFSRDLEMKIGDEMGFLVYSSNRNEIPKVYTSDSSVASVVMVNSNDSRGYYCEIAAKKAGTVTLTAEYAEIKINTQVEISETEMSFSRDFDLNVQETNGFLIYSNNRNNIPNVYTEDSSIAKVTIKRSNDSRGYYCEIIALKKGETTIVAEMDGKKITKKVSATSPDLSVDFSKKMVFEAGVENGFIIIPSYKSKAPNVYIEDTSIAEARIVNANDSRGYYCEIKTKKGGSTNIIIEQDGNTVSSSVKVSDPKLSVSRELNLVGGVKSGFIVQSSNRNKTPNIYIEDTSIANVKVVNNNDPRGYYCEITGATVGITKLIVEQYGVKLEKNVEVVFSRSIDGTVGDTYGFIVSANNGDALQNIYTEDSSIATVELVNENDPRGYYCEVTGKKAGTTNIVVDRNGVLFKNTVTFKEKGILFGIDVSQWNGDINWNLVKQAGNSFAFIRVGGRFGASGTIYNDDYYDQNMSGAIDAGLDVGVYFFTQAISKAEAIEEANYACSNADRYKAEYPIVIDTEFLDGGRHNSLTAAKRTEVVRAFCEQVKRKGYRPMIYGSLFWLNNNLNMSALSDYDVWVAQYNDECNYLGDYKCWQYTSVGSVAGISGYVDRNIWYN